MTSNPARLLLAPVAALALSVAQPAVADMDREPPAAPFKKVSGLVKLPSFIPGIGTLYVDPKTLPAGPVLAYDREGALVSSIYMIPLKDMQAKKKWMAVDAAHNAVDHIDIYYNAGHPGVAEPHYHFVVWYVSKARAAALE